MFLGNIVALSLYNVYRSLGQLYFDSNKLVLLQMLYSFFHILYSLQYAYIKSQFETENKR